MRSHLMEGSFMRKRRLPVAVIALGAVVFVALAGTAAAGGSGLITGVQIKNGSIGLADLSKKAKTSLKGQRGQAGPQGQAGAQGPKGDAGAAGPQGSPGAAGRDGVSGFEIVTYDYISGIGHRQGKPGMEAGYPGVGPGGVATVACSSQDKVAVSGGWFMRDGASEKMDSYVPGLDNGAGVIASFPGRMNWDTNEPKPNRLDGWIVRFNAHPATDVTLYAVCVNAH